MSTAVVVFTGDVRREERRKRLPRRFLASIHSSLLQEMRGVDGCDVYVCGDAPDRAGATGRWEAGSKPVPQQVSEAVSSLFAGYDRVVLVAGDVCGLQRDHVADALRQLDGSGSRAVVGRSDDGGFYLAAFNQQPDVEWSALPWFGPTIGDALIEALDASGFSVAVLDQLPDIDDAGDARRVVGSAGYLPEKLKAILRAVLSAALSFIAVPPPAPSLAFIAPLRRRPPPVSGR